MDSDRRTKYTDERLDDRFTDIDRRLRAVDSLPALIAGLSAQLAALQTQVGSVAANTEKRLDQIDNEVGGVSKAVWYLLAGLLFVAVAAILGIVIVL